MKSVSLHCGEVKSLANASNIFINGTIFRITNPTQLKEDIMKTDVNQLCRYSHQNILDNKVEKVFRGWIQISKTARENGLKWGQGESFLNPVLLLTYFKQDFLNKYRSVNYRGSKPLWHIGALVRKPRTC